MKKIGKVKTIAALTLSAALGLGSFAALAQTSTNEGGDQQTVQKRERRGGRGKFGKHRRGGGRMFGKLNLSEAQKTQLKELRRASRTATKPLGDELRAKRRELRQANEGGVFNEALATQKLTEMASLQAKLMGERIKLRQAMMAVLTPEQKTQLENARAERKAKRDARKAERMKNPEAQND